MGNVSAVTVSEVCYFVPYQRGLEEGGHKSKGTGDLPISVTLSCVHLCQKSSELSAACQASKRFLEKILLHIPRKSEMDNEQ